MVIRDVIPDEQAVSWREELKEFVKANPKVQGSYFAEDAIRHLHDIEIQVSPGTISSSSTFSMSFLWFLFISTEINSVGPNRKSKHDHILMCSQPLCGSTISIMLNLMPPPTLWRALISMCH